MSADVYTRLVDLLIDNPIEAKIKEWLHDTLLQLTPSSAACLKPQACSPYRLPSCFGASTISLASPYEKQQVLRNITVRQDRMSIVMEYPQLSQNASVYVGLKPPSGPPGTEGWEDLPAHQNPCSNYYTKKLSNDSIQDKVSMKLEREILKYKSLLRTTHTSNMCDAAYRMSSSQSQLTAAMPTALSPFAQFHYLITSQIRSETHTMAAGIRFFTPCQGAPMVSSAPCPYIG